ncbi:sphingosine kinase 1 [Lepisosteus oculatus]|uniref:sphingosine kinase 1 n=1 Tax=Lepisosteus oculatus TaxID=7918 RepID=UPI0037199E9A
MDPDKTEPDPPQRNGSPRAQLHGEFTAAAAGKQVRYAVSLTDRELAVQKITSAPAGRNKVLLNLKDCIGCRAFKGADSAEAGAYLSVVFYPFKKKWMGAGLARHRVEYCFEVALSQDARTNRDEAERWASAIRESCVRLWPQGQGVLGFSVPRPSRILVLLNPHSGKGQALSLFTSHIQGMLTEAGIAHQLVITERQNHARELVREADLSQWDALVIMSGDGLLFEVVNGLMERGDWEAAIRTPLGILPGGSGNALAASINHYCGFPPAMGEELLVSCGFQLCRGLVSRLDLAAVHLGSGQRLFSFLSLAWGFVADVDIESEKYRRVGAARFTLGTLVRLASLRTYRGRLAYLPAAGSPPPPPPGSSRRPADPPAALPLYNSCSSNNATQARSGQGPPRAAPGPPGPPDPLLVPLAQPVPGCWTAVPEEDFVLLLAMYQSHLAEDLLAAPAAAPADGLLHLFYVRAGVSRAALLRLFLAMERGAHLAAGCPQLVHVRARAFRLEPLSPKGMITVDGEAVEYGPVQVQVHSGLGRLVTG